jgi:RNA methyltransferase, TrmH family
MSDDKTYPLKPIQWYKDLSMTKKRLEAKVFLVEGSRAIKQIIDNNPRKLVEILTSDEPSPLYQKYPQRQLTDHQLLSISSTKTPQGTIAVVRLPTDSYSDCLPGDLGSRILLLEDVQDPGNVGTLIRSAVAFGYSGIILTDKCADPFSPKCVQSSAGTILSLWIRRTRSYRDLATELQKCGFIMVSTDLSGKEDTSILINNDKLILALGNEASGLSETILSASDYRLRIPIVNEKAESLNVAACGAICMYLSSRLC